MAILFSQADGSDQHYDTYEEFKQAMILMKRLNGEKVPQDLLDEVKAKYGDKDPKPFQVQIEGNNFESAIREAVRDVGEELDRLSMDRTPVSDECENPETEPKLEVGDKVKVVENKSGGHVVGTIGEISEVIYIESQNRWSYEVSPISGHRKNCNLYHQETDLNDVLDPTEFRTGDIVKVTETFEDHFGDRAISGAVYDYDENLEDGNPFVGTVYLGNNIDKLRLVCRKEDRKDIEL